MGFIRDRSTSLILRSLLLAALIGGSCFAPARAELINIIAQSGSGSGSFQLDVPTSDASFDWKPATPISIFSSSGVSLGRITEVSMTLDSDPNVSLGFNVEAGSVPTTFTIASSIVTFAPLVNPLGFATAAITLTDLDGVGGAAATGLFSGGKAYEAQYNLGTPYTQLVLPLSAPNNGSNSTSDRFPGAGSATIVGSLTSIQSSFSFILSANDSASGTSRFNVEPMGVPTPEPSSIVLAGVGAVGLLALGRRRVSRNR